MRADVIPDPMLLCEVSFATNHESGIQKNSILDSRFCGNDSMKVRNPTHILQGYIKLLFMICQGFFVIT